MTAADRRLEIISILVVSGHTTSRELRRNLVLQGVQYYMMFQSSHMGILYTQSRGKAGEFSSWTVTNHIITHSLP